MSGAVERNLAAAARAVAVNGFRVINVHPDGSKAPVGKEWQLRATSDPEKVAALWANGHHDDWIGLAMGDGLIALDIDVKTVDGLAKLAALEADLGPLPATRTHGTPSAGEHRIFDVPRDLKVGNASLWDAEGINIRGNGGQVVAPPSPGYTLKDPRHPASLPDAWVAAIVAGAPRAAGEPSAFHKYDGQVVPIGEQEKTINSRACSYRSRGELSQTEAVGALWAAVQTWPQDARNPWTLEQIEAKVESAWRGIEPAGRIGHGGIDSDVDDGEALPDFPTELLPAALRALVESESARLSLPAGMIATAGIVTAAAAVGGSRVVRTDDREHPASLWGAIVADSGAGKSPAIAVARKPYKDAARIRAQQYDMAWNDAEKWDKADRKTRATTRPDIPSLLLTTDMTTESLADDLSNAPRGMLIDVDELTAWGNAMDAYHGNGAGPDRKRWLGMWNAEAIAITRKRQRAIIVDRPIVSLIGGIQPHAIAGLNSEPDGLAVRLLYSWHVDFEEPYPTRALPDRAVLAAWTQSVGSLLALYDIGVVLPMTLPALDAWHAGRVERIDAARKYGYRMLYGKFDAMTARLALVLTLVDDYSARFVDAYHVEVAWRILLDYYGPHGRASLRGTEPKVKCPGIDWLREHSPTTRREIVKWNVANCAKQGDADALIARWVAAGLAKATENHVPGGVSVAVEAVA